MFCSILWPWGTDSIGKKGKSNVWKRPSKDGLAFAESDMLIYRRTSILESSAQTVVNTVNCVGVMGKGLAHAYKEREPRMFAAYKRLCEQGLLQPGKLWLWRGRDNWVLNFPTKIHWRNPAKLEWIEAGLQKFVLAYEAQGIHEVSFPRLGCGNGGLDWEEVRPLMERYLAPLPIPVYIHDYTVDIGLPEHLETVAQTLRNEEGAEATFDSFLTALRRAIDLTGNNFVEIESSQPFEAEMIDMDDLRIRTEACSWTFEHEDLRGVWVSLQKGLVTKEKAGWSVQGGGRPLLSVLSVLPHVRPVQIQRSQRKEPEIAVELTPDMRKIAVAPHLTAAQREMAWH